jgi:DNA-binding MarR family transcriptional regulator
MAPSGVSATQLPILLVLGSAGDVSVTVLSEALALDGATLCRSLKVLGDRGLIRMTNYEGDACVRMVSLTPEGSRILAGAVELLQAVQHSAVARFGRPHFQALYDELDALSAAVSE